MILYYIILYYIILYYVSYIGNVFVIQCLLYVVCSIVCRLPSLCMHITRSLRNSTAIN